MSAQRQIPKLSVKTGISLRLRNSLKTLAMGQIELKEKLQETLEENPFLEEVGMGKHLSIPARGLPEQTLKEGTGNVDYFTRNVSLGEYLRTQIELSNLPKKLMPLSVALLSNLDENGFTQKSHSEITQEAGYSSRELKTVLSHLKELDPPGIAAEDLWQSLSWQADILFPGDALLPDIIEILRQARGSLLKLSYQEKKQLAETLHLDEKIVDEKVLRLQQLDPYPARNYRKTESEYVYPEIKFIETPAGMEISVREILLPVLNVNRKLYEEFLEADKQRAKAWEEKYKEALDLIQSMEYRHSSLSLLAKILVEKQSDFFTRGPAFVKPMSLADVASVTKLHISTISRIVSRKHCQCKWGIFPLKFFFPAKLKTFDGESRGAEELRQAILALVASENPAVPLSDQDITDILVKKGFDVSRRTVAKYRKLLHISASGRRLTAG